MKSMFICSVVCRCKMRVVYIQNRAPRDTFQQKHTENELSWEWERKKNPCTHKNGWKSNTKNICRMLWMLTRSLHGTLLWLMGELNKQQLNIFLFGHRLLHFVSSLFQMCRWLLFFLSFFLFWSTLNSTLLPVLGSLISHRLSNCRRFYGVSRFDVTTLFFTHFIIEQIKLVEKIVNAINWHRILDAFEFRHLSHCLAIFAWFDPMLIHSQWLHNVCDMWMLCVCLATFSGQMASL